MSGILTAVHCWFTAAGVLSTITAYALSRRIIQAPPVLLDFLTRADSATLLRPPVPKVAGTSTRERTS